MGVFLGDSQVFIAFHSPNTISCVFTRKAPLYTRFPEFSAAHSTTVLFIVRPYCVGRCERPRKGGFAPSAFFLHAALACSVRRGRTASMPALPAMQAGQSLGSIPHYQPGRRVAFRRVVASFAQNIGSRHSHSRESGNPHRERFEMSGVRNGFPLTRE